MSAARGRLIGLAGLACLAAAGLPSQAAGAGDDKVTYVLFEAEASNGYDLQFVGRGSDNAERARIWTEKGRNWAEWTTVGGELVDAKVSKGSGIAIYDLERARSIGSRLEVGMGSLGRLSARFRTGRVETYRRPCVTVTARSGHFVGDLRFAGEDGYASLDESRIRARFVTVGRKCGNRNTRSVGRSVRAAGRWRPLSLLACGPTPRVALAASRDRYFGSFFAVKVDRTDAARIIRIADVTRLGDSFTYRRNLESAKLRPDPPYFSGEARYADASLSGNLKARFPGVGWTALAPGEASLARRNTDPLPCQRVFGLLSRSVASGEARRVPAGPLGFRLGPHLPRRSASAVIR